MATRIGSAFFDVTFNTAAARREVTALVSTANRQFGLLGGIGIVGATLAVGALTKTTVDLGAAALTAANEYEQAFASVRKTLDTGTMSAAQSEVVFGRLSDELRGLALVTPLDLSDDLAEIAALGGQLGIAAEDIKEFTQVIAEVGVTTNVAVDDAAVSFARIANIMGIPESQFRRFGDTLIHLGNNLATREDEILRFGLRIAAAGDIAGLTSDEVLALSAAMSAVGVPAERGGTAVQRVLIEITESVANLDDRLETFAGLAGQSAEEFAAAWETDAGGAFLNFVEGLGLAGDEAFAILDDLELGNLRTIQSFLSLANAGPLLRESFELAAESAGALETEAEIFFGTTQSNLTLLGNAATDAGIRMGNSLQDPLNEIIDLTREWINTNPELINQLGVNMAGALEGLIPLWGELLNVVGDALLGVTEFFDDLVNEPGGGGIRIPVIIDIIPDDGGGEGRAGEFADFLQRGFAFDPHIARVNQFFDTLIQESNDGRSDFLKAFIPIVGIFELLVEDQAAALTIVETELRETLRREGGDPLEHLVDSFVDLQNRLEPLGGSISELGFAELTDEIKLTEEETRSLIDLLIEAGVRLPGSLLGPFQTLQDELGSLPGRIPGSALSPETVDAINRELEFDRIAEEAEAAAERAELFVDALTGVRDAAEDSGLPIATLLENMRLLSPEVAAAVSEFGAAEIATALWAESFQGLENALEFDPGVAIASIDLLTGAVEEGNTSITEMQRNAEEALDQLAEFEAGKAILEALGLDQLVTAVEEMDFGTAVHAVQDLVDDLPRAFELEATLDTGGTLSEDLEADLAAVLATVDITPELMDMASQFSSDEVQQIILDAAEAQGVAFGDTLGGPDVTNAMRNSGIKGGEDFGVGVQAALDQLGLEVEVAVSLGVVDPRLQAIIAHSKVEGGAAGYDPNLSTRPPPEVTVNINSGGTTSGDAARAGQAIRNISMAE